MGHNYEDRGDLGTDRERRGDSRGDSPSLRPYGRETSRPRTGQGSYLFTPFGVVLPMGVLVVHPHVFDGLLEGQFRSGVLYPTPRPSSPEKTECVPVFRLHPYE